ncbi:MAG: hypothetical protein GY761_03850 [Hyphomicrobiales bacterium]|nr:hypothetical protein [Hyphomicrobiales bacterium]
MHILLRILLTMVSALLTVVIMIVLGGKPGTATGIPGVVVVFIVWWITGRGVDNPRL